MKLGRYEVVRELGKGAMGVVYLAKDPLIGRLVALKTIRIGAHADDDETKEFQQRFIREAQAAGILNHPSIVTVHDIGQDDGSGVSFIAMEYVEGQNLKEVLNQGRALSFEQIGDIIAQVAEALDFAHAKGIVHRDVKPANVILVDGTRAKITDFGIAKIASGAANLTTTGQFLGTPNYMAPEQVKGAPVDGRTDIFALGICLYECLTRRKPFGGDSLTSISYKIVHEPFPPIHEINPRIPEGFEDVVAHCLAKDPAKRYQRARDLANALRAVIRGDKPSRPTEPILAEETMVTRDRGPIVIPQPTVEVPFPQAMDASPVPGASSTRPAAGSNVAQQPMAKTEVVPIPTMAPPPPPPPPASPPTVATPMPKMPAVPVSQQLRRTLTNVRTMPLWKRHIPPAIFFGVVALFAIALLAGVVALKMQQPPLPNIDRVAEARHLRERDLRLRGEQQLREGRVTDAYATYSELQRLAPKSPFVANVMQKLNAIRQQDEVSKQQLAVAKQKYDQGVVLLSEKKYPEAIAALQESFSINPNSIEAAEALKLAQAEQLKAEQAKALTRQQRQASRQQQQQNSGNTRTDTAATTTTTQPVTPAEPVQFTTLFDHPFTDGRIIVRIGGDIVANEALFTERRRKVFNTLVKQPRPIAVTKDFPSKNADVTIWITVSPLGINENHTLPAVRFEAGRSYRLVVRYNAASKRFSYELN